MGALRGGGYDKYVGKFWGMTIVPFLFKKQEKNAKLLY